MGTLHAADSIFLFKEYLVNSLLNEELSSTFDIRPMDRTPPDLLDAEDFDFFGTSPLTSPSSTPLSLPLSSPPSSRAALPNPSSTLQPTTSTTSSALSPMPSKTAVDVNAKPSASNSKSKRTKRHGHKNRREKRQKSRHESHNQPYEARNATLTKHVKTAEKILSAFDAKDFPIAATRFMSLRGEDGRIYRIKELLEKHGFRLEKWDGRQVPPYNGRVYLDLTFNSTARPIVDTSGHIIAVLVGQPDDGTWEAVHRGAFEAICKSRAHCDFPKKTLKHRCGHFPTLNWGISHGGGQKVGSRPPLYNLNSHSITL